MKFDLPPLCWTIQVMKYFGSEVTCLAYNLRWGLIFIISIIDSAYLGSTNQKQIPTDLRGSSVCNWSICPQHVSSSQKGLLRFLHPREIIHPEAVGTMFLFIHNSSLQICRSPRLLGLLRGGKEQRRARRGASRGRCVMCN